MNDKPLEVIQHFLPAYNEVNHSKGNFGKHCVDYSLYIKETLASGEERFVALTIFTKWWLPGDRSDKIKDIPDGAGVTRCSTYKLEDHDYKCEHESSLIDSPYYTDTSYLLSDSVVESLLRKGSRGMYQEMLKHFNNWFDTSHKLSDLDVPEWTYKKDPYGFDSA